MLIDELVHVRTWGSPLPGVPVNGLRSNNGSPGSPRCSLGGDLGGCAGDEGFMVEDPWYAVRKLLAYCVRTHNKILL